MNFTQMNFTPEAVNRLFRKQEAVNRQILAQNIRREILVRKMLEQWVSGCDPCLVYQSYGLTDHLMGLGLDGDETGLIVIPIPKETPQC